jgi:glyoxylase-like metal-dependent hydrolase (beta-lactamase superfamily II)
MAACSDSPPASESSGEPIDLGNVVLHPLGSQVYAAIRTEPEGLAVNANSLFIVNESDVVVVDAQFTRAATLENIAALRRITDKPVSHVLTTHWHDDHVAGNQVYQDSFPGVQFLATPATRADIVAMGRPNREGQVRYGPAALERYQRLLDMGLGIDSTPVSPLEHVSVSSAIALFSKYVEENPDFREVLPDTLNGPGMALVRGSRTIELHWFGRGNTRGDLVAWLPSERIMATGDLLVAPVPFGFNSYPSEWIAVLDSIAARNPAVLVPGHGPVMRDLMFLNTVRQMLTAARDETRHAVREGLDADATRAAVTLDDWRARVAGDDKWLVTLFNQFFLQPVVARLYEEATNGPLQ